MVVDLEVICVGNELLIGKVKDTNAHYIAQQATHLGINVKRVTVIQDTVDEIAHCIQDAIARKTQFIVTTGGLGPTFDDKTLEGVAKAFNKKVAVNQQALEVVKRKCIAYAQKRGMPLEVELTPQRVKMATLPENSIPISNPVGTAPAVRVDIGETTLFSLPGVPGEVEAIFTETIAPLLRQAVGSSVFCEQSVYVQGMFESRLSPLIDKVMVEIPGVYVKSHPVLTVNNPRLELHLTITDKKEQFPSEKLLRAANRLAALIQENGGIAQVRDLG